MPAHVMSLTQTLMRPALCLFVDADFIAFKQQMEGEPEMLPSAEAQLDAKEQEKKAAHESGRLPNCLYWMQTCFVSGFEAAHRHGRLNAPRFSWLRVLLVIAKLLAFPLHASRQTV